MSVFTTIGGFFLNISKIRSCFVSGLLGFALLSVPDQTYEIFRIMAQDYNSGGWHGFIQGWFTYLFSVLISLYLWVLSRRLTSNKHRNNLGYEGKQENEILATWVNRIMVAVIPIGAAIGLAAATQDINISKYSGEWNTLDIEFQATASEFQNVVSWLIQSSILYFFTALSLLIFVYVIEKDEQDFSSIFLRVFLRYIYIFVSILMFILVILSVMLYISIPAIMGPLPLLLAFLAMIAFIGGVITKFFDRFSIPIFLILFVLSILFSALNLNNSGTVSSEAVKTIKPLESISQAQGGPFSRWLNTRMDLNEYDENTPYPVFIVAASGGGMYAAEHTATVLARIQDRCPQFSQHIFAISGVSGGSLGAAIFSGLAKDRAHNQNNQLCKLGPAEKGVFEQKVEDFFSKADLLSPILAKMFFSDFFQNFLPTKLPVGDRASVLEEAVEDAWVAAGLGSEGKNFFGKNFLEHWDEGGANPALIFNTTDVYDGGRVIIAPFDLENWAGSVQGVSEILYPFTGILHFYKHTNWLDVDSKPTRDIKLRTAMSLSARFPWILPTGTVENSENDKIQLVDGSYFENSGTETTFDLLKQLHRYFENPGQFKKMEAKKLIKTYVITVGSDAVGSKKRWYANIDALSPLLTLLSTRERRGYLSTERLKIYRMPCIDEMQTWTEPCDSNLVKGSILNSKDFSLPLGWKLSDNSRKIIGIFSGRADKAKGRSEGALNGTDLERLKLNIDMDDITSCYAIYVLMTKSGAVEWNKNQQKHCQ